MHFCSKLMRNTFSHGGAAASEQFRHKHKFLILFFFYPINSACSHHLSEGQKTKIATCLITRTIHTKKRWFIFGRDDPEENAEVSQQGSTGQQHLQLQRRTHTTEGRAQPSDRNITQQKPLRARSWRDLSGKWSDLLRVANQQGAEVLCRNVSLHISIFHPAKSSLVCWDPCLGSSADERISPWYRGSACGWPWCCLVSADTQPQSCPTAPLVLVGTQLPAAASASSKPWHPRVLLSFACIAPTKVGKYLLKTTQKIFGRISN